MPRVTKLILEDQLKSLNELVRELRLENSHLREINKLLQTRQFDVDAFCRMHADGMTAIAQSMTSLRAFINRGFK